MSAPHDRYVLDSELIVRGAAVDDDMKVSYAAALYYFARIGGVSEEEERTIERLARSLDIDRASLELARKAGLDSHRLRSLLTKIDGAWIVRDALRIAHADGIVGQDESRVIDKLAEATGLSPARLAWIHAWVEREVAMSQEWDAIMAAGPARRSASD